MRREVASLHRHVARATQWCYDRHHLCPLLPGRPPAPGLPGSVHHTLVSAYSPGASARPWGAPPFSLVPAPGTPPFQGCSRNVHPQSASPGGQGGGPAAPRKPGSEKGSPPSALPFTLPLGTPPPGLSPPGPVFSPRSPQSLQRPDTGVVRATTWRRWASSCF